MSPRRGKARLARTNAPANARTGARTNAPANARTGAHAIAPANARTGAPAIARTGAADAENPNNGRRGGSCTRPRIRPCTRPRIRPCVVSIEGRRNACPAVAVTRDAAEASDPCISL
ncbi:MAG: hypothetical protein LBR08_00860 [Bacteroidales bacterium]|nr:hypothetical protein [Bacteroidales bacterium]